MPQQQQLWAPLCMNASPAAVCEAEAPAVLPAAMFIMLCMASGDMLAIMLLADCNISGDICIPAASKHVLVMSLSCVFAPQQCGFYIWVTYQSGSCAAVQDIASLA